MIYHYFGKENFNPNYCLHKISNNCTAKNAQRSLKSYPKFIIIWYLCFYASSGELIFEPGDMEFVIAVNILDDTIPEEEERFTVWLKNPKGGAEIGAHGFVNIIIPSNDNAYGVIAFAQVKIIR